jgi:hypothetical protein
MFTKVVKGRKYAYVNVAGMLFSLFSRLNIGHVLLLLLLLLLLFRDYFFLKEGKKSNLASDWPQ